MKLHDNKKLFQQAIRFTADQMGIPPVYVEKDYWVTFALNRIFTDQIGKDVVFKGGTALSKCYDLIERFSEDIDLVAIRRDGESDNQMKKKLKAIGQQIEPELPEVPLQDITRKKGMNRKTAHTYHKEFTGSYGQVRDVIILETTWLGYYEPFKENEVISFIGKMILANGQGDMAEEKELLPFSVFALNPTRTICEKIMSLVRFSHTEYPIANLKNKVRHIYDLNQLLKQPDLDDFFLSTAFDKMLLKVGKDDVRSFRNNKQWLAIPPKDALIFKETDKTWKEIEEVYTQEFRNLVYGKLPAGEDLLNVLQKIAKRLEKVDWPIEIDEDL